MQGEIDEEALLMKLRGCPGRKSTISELASAMDADQKLVFKSLEHLQSMGEVVKADKYWIAKKSEGLIANYLDWDGNLKKLRKLHDLKVNSILIGPKGCLTGDSLVNGQRIDELARSRKTFKTWTPFGESLAVAFKTGYKQVYRLSTSIGNIYATGDHPFLTTKGWSSLSYLTSEDLLVNVKDGECYAYGGIKVPELREDLVGIPFTKKEILQPQMPQDILQQGRQPDKEPGDESQDIKDSEGILQSYDKGGDETKDSLVPKGRKGKCKVCGAMGEGEQELPISKEEEAVRGTPRDARESHHVKTPSKQDDELGKDSIFLADRTGSILALGRDDSYEQVVEVSRFLRAWDEASDRMRRFLLAQGYPKGEIERHGAFGCGLHRLTSDGERDQRRIRPQDTVRVFGYEPCGIAETYNLHVIGSNMFYVNGLLTHNCGKTECVLELARQLNKPIHTVNLSLRSRESHILGRLDITEKDGVQQVAWKKGPLPLSMEAGGILYLDELSAGEPDVLLRLDECLDGRRQLSYEGQTIEANENWYPVSSINPLSTQGTKELPPQIISRFTARLYFTYPEPAIELDIVRNHIGNFEREIRDQLTMTIKYFNKLRQTNELPYSPSIRESIALGTLLKGGMEYEEALPIIAFNQLKHWDDESYNAAVQIAESMGLMSRASMAAGRQFKTRVTP